MAMEIERKFLVRDNTYKSESKPVYYQQGYISTRVENVVRVRIAGDKAYLTLKSLVTHISRLEYEYEIPVVDAREILDRICRKPIIEKNRYEIKYGRDTWVVDEFFGENKGLVVAEIELETENQEIILPDWVGDEVTDDSRYLNANLAVYPYCQWSEDC